MLSGYDLPPAETLAAHAAVCARAQEYKDCGAFPGVLTDQLRAMAYLDLMNGISAGARIAAGPPEVGLGAPGEGAFRDEPEPDDPGAAAPGRRGGSDCPCDECDGRCAPPADDPAPTTTSPRTLRARDDGGPDDGRPDDCPTPRPRRQRSGRPSGGRPEQRPRGPRPSRQRLLLSQSDDRCRRVRRPVLARRGHPTQPDQPGPGGCSASDAGDARPNA